MTTGLITRPPVTGTSTLRLRELRMLRQSHVEGRPAEWIVGRGDTGDFVAMPEAGVEAIRLLGRGLTTGEVRRRLHADHGRDLDVVDFGETLCELGFVTAVDGHAVVGPPPRPPSLPRLRPAHVRWVLRPVTWLVMCAVMACGLAAAILDGEALPRPTDVVWSDHVGVVILGHAVLGWSLILLHELAHLAVARAAGVPAWMSLGTRLQYLAAQTDVSCLWAATRRVRMAAYLAGMALDLTMAAAATLVLALAEPSGWPRAALSLLVLLAVLGVAGQGMVFMRTDLYFVLQELSRSPNLYAAGAAYLGYRLRRLRGRDGLDPTAALPVGERRWVRSYTVIQSAGTALCLAGYVLVVVPIMGELVSQAVRLVVAADSMFGVLNGALVLAVVGAVQVLWLRVWLRRHGPRLRRWVAGRS